MIARIVGGVCFYTGWAAFFTAAILWMMGK